MNKEKIRKFKKIEKKIVDLSVMIFVLEKALDNPNQEGIDTIPYADMTKIIYQKLQKILGIFFD